jgi:hypothetical protein
MKVSRREINKIILEELEAAVESGEITEQQLQELLPGLKALGKAAWGGVKKAAGKVRDIYKSGEEAAKAQKAGQQQAGAQQQTAPAGVNITRTSAGPAQTGTTQLAATPNAAPAAAQQPQAAAKPVATGVAPAAAKPAPAAAKPLGTIKPGESPPSSYGSQGFNKTQKNQVIGSLQSQGFDRATVASVVNSFSDWLKNKGKTQVKEGAGSSKVAELVYQFSKEYLNKNNKPLDPKLQNALVNATIKAFGSPDKPTQQAAKQTATQTKTTPTEKTGNSSSTTPPAAGSTSSSSGDVKPNFVTQPEQSSVQGGEVTASASSIGSTPIEKSADTSQSTAPVSVASSKKRKAKRTAKKASNLEEEEIQESIVFNRWQKLAGLIKG